MASRVVLIMVMVRGGSSASFRRSSDDMDDLGRSMHEDEPDRLILDYELRYVEIYAACIRYDEFMALYLPMYEFVDLLIARDLLSIYLAYVYRTYVRLRSSTYVAT